MAVSLDYQPGATPLDPDEAGDLIPSHITTHGQLNEWEPYSLSIPVPRPAIQPVGQEPMPQWAPTRCRMRV